MKVFLVMAAFITGVVLQSPYVDETRRDIKALSEEQIAGYLNGDGMGYALPAELNSYPGPKHVLELGDELELSPEQRAGVSACFESMHTLAQELGARLVELEGRLDAAFAAGSIAATELESPDFDSRAVLREHRRRLVQRLSETEALVATIDRTLSSLEGETEMSIEERFDGFQPPEHAAEANQRWGVTDAYKEATRRAAKYGPAEWETIQAEADGIVLRFAACCSEGAAADSEAAIQLAEEHRQHIDRWFYACSQQMHAGLAEMYVHDERFAEYFDKHGEGLSGFVAEAIRANAAGPSS